MKKIYSLLLMSVMLTGFTSCLDTNEDNETSFTIGMYQRVVTDGTGDVSEFFNNNYYLTVNLTQGTVNIDVTATISKDKTLSFSTGTMTLTADQEMSAYRFSSPSITTQGSTISNFKGIIDLQHGVAYISFIVDNEKTVYGTANLPFMFNTTRITPSAEGEKEYDANELQYDFTINKSKMTATLLILNYITDNNNKGSSTQVAVFEGLDLKLTRDGYVISSPSVKSTTSGKGNVADAELKDVEFTIHSQGTRMEGTYTTDKYTANVTGTMFNEQSK